MRDVLACAKTTKALWKVIIVIRMLALVMVDVRKRSKIAKGIFLFSPTTNTNCLKVWVRETAVRSQVIVYCYSLSGLFNGKQVAPLLSLSIWKSFILIRLPQSNRCFHQVLFAQMRGGIVIAFSSEQKLLQSGLQRSAISLRGLGRERPNEIGVREGWSFS